MAPSRDQPRDPDHDPDLDRLCAAVWRDEALQDRLRAMTEETAFVAAVIEAGTTMGLRIEEADVVARMRGTFTVLMLPGVFA